MGKRNAQSSHSIDEDKANVSKSKDDEEKNKSDKMAHNIRNRVSKSKNNLKIKKPTKIKFDDDNNPQEVNIITGLKDSKSKKTEFIDDEPQAVPSNSGQSSVSGKRKKKHNLNELEDEETVKDEDIDKFCEQISPDDNVQFENWVKLIEAKLHAKK